MQDSGEGGALVGALLPLFFMCFGGCAQTICFQGSGRRNEHTAILKRPGNKGVTVWCTGKDSCYDLVIKPIMLMTRASLQGQEGAVAVRFLIYFILYAFNVSILSCLNVKPQPFLVDPHLY